MDKHDEIMQKLGLLEGELGGIKNELRRMNGAVAANTERTRILEQWRDGWVGKLSVIAVFIGAGITIIVNWVLKLFKE
jgi:hypothetical protein